MGSQLNRCGLVLERSVLIEQLIDPEREIEGSAIKIVLLESFTGGSCIVDAGLFLFVSSFIAARIIKIGFQQLHVFLGLPVLLLKKTLPIVFVPHAFRLVPVAGHAELNASFSFRAKLFRGSFLSASTLELQWLHHGPQSVGSAS